MKKVVVIILTILISYGLFAKKIEGKILYKNHSETVLMNVPMDLLGRNPEFIKLQYRVKYWDGNGDKQILKPHEAQGIQFTVGNETFTLISRENEISGFTNIFLNSTHIFLLLEMDGPLKLFTYFYTQTSGGGPNSTPMTTVVAQDLIQKIDGPLKRPPSLMFRKHMVPYFKDCPELAGMIKDKEFRSRDLVAIVSFYNNHCN